MTMISRVYRRGQDSQGIYDEIVKGVQPEIKNY